MAFVVSAEISTILGEARPKKPSSTSQKNPKKTYGIRLKTRVVHPMVTTQFDHLTAPTREDLLHNKHHLEPSTRIQFALGILMGAVEIQSGNMLRGWAVKHIRQERCRGLVTL